MKRTAPFITPFAIFSAVLALGATNVVVNTATHTVEGKPKTEVVEKTTPSQKTPDQPTDKTKNISRMIKIRIKQIIKRISKSKMQITII